ncbi:hypothetical protein LshimejAT787_2000730 [Lyophyllum shimeji]|uniref:Uncharacterized protein n=1 Tax=Lyophyllum shimeji TaxID=47721 RepID=A0A9P3Q123_LYOSH|nr:hypothetical protein LshimejAT787_2000730 [Lyophyllum shimeji]
MPRPCSGRGLSTAHRPLLLLPPLIIDYSYTAATTTTGVRFKAQYFTNRAGFIAATQLPIITSARDADIYSRCLLEPALTSWSFSTACRRASSAFSFGFTQRVGCISGGRRQANRSVALEPPSSGRPGTSDRMTGYRNRSAELYRAGAPPSVGLEIRAFVTAATRRRPAPG